MWRYYEHSPSFCPAAKLLLRKGKVLTVKRKKKGVGFDKFLCLVKHSIQQEAALTSSVLVAQQLPRDSMEKFGHLVHPQKYNCRRYSTS